MSTATAPARTRPATPQRQPRKTSTTPAYDALPRRRRRFVDLYLGSCRFNATRAYVEAGFAPTGATGNASRMIADDSISEAIDERMQGHGVTPARTVLEIAAIAFGRDSVAYEQWLSGERSLAALADAGEIDPGNVKSLSQSMNEKGGVTRRVELHDRLRALGTLVRVLGLEADRTVRIEFDYASLPADERAALRVAGVVDAEFTISADPYCDDAVAVPDDG